MEIINNNPQNGYLGFPGDSAVKNLPAVKEMQVQSLGQEDPWRRAWRPTPVPLPGESHAWRSLGGCGPWGHKESDMTETTEHACRQMVIWGEKSAKLICK